MEYNVWEEPALSTDLAGSPAEDQLTYSRWLKSCIESMTFLKSMQTTLLVALAAGPWGVLGAFWTSLSGAEWGAAGLMAVVGFWASHRRSRQSFCGLVGD